jgi:hypothetical protein
MRVVARGPVVATSDHTVRRAFAPRATFAAAPSFAEEDVDDISVAPDRPMD